MPRKPKPCPCESPQALTAIAVLLVDTFPGRDLPVGHRIIVGIACPVCQRRQEIEIGRRWAPTTEEVQPSCQESPLLS